MKVKILLTLKQFKNVDPPLQICIQYLRIKAPTCTQPVPSRPKDPCPVCKVIHPHVNMGRRIKPNTIVYRHSRQC